MEGNPSEESLALARVAAATERYVRELGVSLDLLRKAIGQEAFRILVQERLPFSLSRAEQFMAYATSQEPLTEIAGPSAEALIFGENYRRGTLPRVRV